MTAETVTNETTTLDDAFKALRHWRNNKKSYEGSGIPDSFWQLVFQLKAQGYAKKELCQLFSLNSGQYDKKQKQLHEQEAGLAEASTTPTTAQDSAILFSEAVVSDAAPPIPSLTQAAQQTKQVITKLKSSDNHPRGYLDTTTTIVECFRPDEHRLKIHTTIASLDSVMQAFFNQEVIPA